MDSFEFKGVDRLDKTRCSFPGMVFKGCREMKKNTIGLKLYSISGRA